MCRKNWNSTRDLSAVEALGAGDAELLLSYLTAFGEHRCSR